MSNKTKANRHKTAVIESLKFYIQLKKYWLDKFMYEFDHVIV